MPTWRRWPGRRSPWGEARRLPHHYSQSCQFLDANGGISFHNFDAGYVDATDVTDLSARAAWA